MTRGESPRQPCHILVMAKKRIKRPRDPIERAKLIGDIATGQLEDALKEPKRRVYERGQMNKSEDKKPRQN